MADDLDDLLSEVESKYCGKSSYNGSKSTQKTGRSGQQRKDQKKTDLSSMIEDIFDDEPLDFIPNKETKNHSHSSLAASRVTTSSGQKRCFPLFFGGSSTAQGLATAVNKRTCDSMRCTDCDFQVCTFDNFQWHKSTDYLFLRNNIPDFDRLKAKLTSKKGYRAYACQCKWKSVGELQEVGADLKWVCGKH